LAGVGPVPRPDADGAARAEIEVKSGVVTAEDEVDDSTGVVDPEFVIATICRRRRDGAGEKCGSVD
jgi:acyl dehydratase